MSCDFVSHYQYITDFWLLHRGFSVGIEDCLAVNQDSLDQEIKSELAKAYIEVRSIMQSETHADLCELKINTALNNVRDIGGRISDKNLTKNNAIKAMVVSGSKGSMINTASILGIVGQQNVGGKRIEKRFHGRSFPHYTRTSFSSEARDYINPRLSEERQQIELEKLLESRGFIVNSYIKGLTPIEFFTHQQGGREGLLSTAISTSTTGYLQRRIVKTMEDVKCSYLGTIVNQKGKVVQFSYGQDGMDTAKMVYVDGKLSFMDIARRTAQLNNEFEMKTW